MLALYSADPKQVPRLRSALPPQPRVVAVQDWEQLHDVIPQATCSVIHVDQLASSSGVPRLSALKSRHPRHPVVLVTRWDLENARQLKDLTVEEVIWLQEVEQGLRTAVERACAQEPNYVYCLALPFERAEHLPPVLREALAHACRSERPVHSVNELAAAVDRNRRSLWHQWNRAVDGAPLRLQDFLHWILLLRALGKKTPERSWAAVAEELRMSPQTLWRYARDLTGCTLPALAEAQEETIRLFRARVLAFLLDREALDIL
ncbi:MAG TPA: hypothetical protein VGB92_01175 [Longimicrobium sp.]|jgi:hypothetical protein